MNVQLPAIKKSKVGTLPNLIIIGAMKCATTSLHYYLNLHPEISMSREKELNFFIPEYDWYKKGNWPKGIEWYKSHFVGATKIQGEASPNYTYRPFFSGVAERMYSVIPEAKLIYILRDPVERIISQYIHHYATEIENRPISEALANFDHNVYVSRSLYAMQLGDFLDYFPRSRVLVITQEDLQRRRRQTLQTVFNFLDVDPAFYCPKFSRIKHTSNHKRRKNGLGIFLAETVGKSFIESLSPEIREKAKTLMYFPFSRPIARPVLDEGLRARLVDYLSSDINRLRSLTGQEFLNWCV